MSGNRKSHEAIWQTVLSIPPGKVASYGQVADLAGLPGRARLVGRSMGMVPDSMQVPWYRVLKSNGQLAGKPGSKFAQRQTELLQDEGVVVLKNRVKMENFQWQPSLDEMLFKLDY
ncbi:MAG: cysteine methyltransferase [Gammaproteobacteria bacterium]|nr:cysteine methyltransferase [Gammaproteobacteria bacterium]MAY03217.1 cysteine methyltransferase [Gammaproteobacteria bacterium]|tara:strand:- start:25 stop:372 length:348 start_codon:yes stop_codon:yes gene_type:complete